jgi:hypothetical protein
MPFYDLASPKYRFPITRKMWLPQMEVLAEINQSLLFSTSAMTL